jgi:hypothetical protein
MEDQLMKYLETLWTMIEMDRSKYALKYTVELQRIAVDELKGQMLSIHTSKEGKQL